MLVSLEDIKIPEVFLISQPNENNILKHKEYYIEHKAFKDVIVINNKSHMLIEGYIDYLVAVKNGITEINCELRNSKREHHPSVIQIKNQTKKKDSIRMYLLEQYDGRCAICGKKLQADEQKYKNSYVTIDHIIPQSRGGLDELENLQPLCRRCNRIKGDMLPEEFEKVYSGSLKID